MRIRSLLVLLMATVPALAQQMRTFHDHGSRMSFDIPAGWTLSTRDGEVSTFHLDARSAPPAMKMRAVMSIDANPFPLSTFAGAFVYFSVGAGVGKESCQKQATDPVRLPLGPMNRRSMQGTPQFPTSEPIAGIPFVHGHDQHGGVCVEARDEVYTGYRMGRCYRFDLVTNTFCEQESGAKEITPAQLHRIQNTMEGVLHSARF